jgi:hypothetical protein
MKVKIGDIAQKAGYQSRAPLADDSPFQSLTNDYPVRPRRSMNQLGTSNTSVSSTTSKWNR